jgi:hypothetical protein
MTSAFPAKLPQLGKEKKASGVRCKSVELSGVLATEGSENISGEQWPSVEKLLPVNTRQQPTPLPVRQLGQRPPYRLFKLGPSRNIKPAILCAPALAIKHSSVGMVHSLPIKKPGKTYVVRRQPEQLPLQVREVKKRIGALLRKHTKPQIAIFHKGFPPYRRTVEYNLFRNVRKYAFNRSLSGLL